MPSNQYRPLTRPQYHHGTGGAHGSLRIRLQRTLRDPYLVAKANRSLTFVSALFLLLTFLASLGSNDTTDDGDPRRKSANGQCNPFLLPGFLSQLPSGLSTYRTYDPACRVPGLLPTLLSHMSTSPYMANVLVPPAQAIQGTKDLHAKMSNRTVFLIGDSTDQFLLTHFCNILGKPVVAVNQRHPWGASLAQVPKEHVRLPGSRDSYADSNPGDKPLAHYCYVPGYDFLVSSIYHMGIDVADTFQGKPAWTAPAKFEDRVTDLFVPYAQAMARPPSPNAPSLPPPRRQAWPDVAVLASSFWDLARYAQDDIDMRRSLVDDLSEHSLLAWRSRHVDMLDSLQKAWPSSTLGWRSMHLPTESESTTVEWWVSGQKDAQSTDHPLFHSNRIVALNEARRSTMYPTGDDIVRGRINTRTARLPPKLLDVDWGRIMVGQDHKQADRLHPGLNPGGSVFAEMLLAVLL